jgi:hypothetical protein
MEIIRQAIVGDPTRRLNGQTEISGFAADMGRLPECIAELIEVSGAIPSTTPQEYGSPCGSGAANITAWHIDSTTGNTWGWRGPYIRVSPEFDGSNRFRDGYGNSNTTDNINSGWSYTIDTSGAITLSSSGLDGIVSNSDDINNSNLVTSTDWQIHNIIVEIINQDTSNALPSTDVDLNLRVFLDGNTFVTGDDGLTTALTISASNPVEVANSKNYTFSFDSSNAIPSGIRAFTLVCHEVPSGSPNSYVIFDGDCDLTNNTPTSNDIKTFFVAPRQTPYLNWTIQ